MPDYESTVISTRGQPSKEHGTWRLSGQCGSGRSPEASLQSQFDSGPEGWAVGGVSPGSAMSQNSSKSHESALLNHTAEHFESPGFAAAISPSAATSSTENYVMKIPQDENEAALSFSCKLHSTNASTSFINQSELNVTFKHPLHLSAYLWVTN